MLFKHRLFLRYFSRSCPKDLKVFYLRSSHIYRYLRPFIWIKEFTFYLNTHSCPTTTYSPRGNKFDRNHNSFIRNACVSDDNHQLLLDIYLNNYSVFFTLLLTSSGNNSFAALRENKVLCLKKFTDSSKFFLVL